MRVAITGSHGFIGWALARHLEDRGDQVVRLVRRRPVAAGEAFWDPEAGTVDSGALEGVDHLIHLAGENIGARPWTAKRRGAIRDSRVRGTELIARTLAGMRPKPLTMVSASAMGYYGDRGDELLTEDSPSGRGFRAEVCVAWERATEAAASAGIRVVLLRSGIVLSRKGGLFPYLLRPARIGAALRLGSGRQFWSWITRDDAVAAMIHVIERTEIDGPVIVAAPEPVRQADFAHALAETIGRGRIIPLPAWALRVALGRERAAEVLLSSDRATPKRLLESGYPFRHAVIGDALRSIVR
jgi:hypothetical protein